MTREEAWVRFAAGAMADANVTETIAADCADRLLAEFDKRFPQPDINKQFNQQIEKTGQRMEWMEGMRCSACHGTGLVGSLSSQQAFCGCSAGYAARRKNQRETGV